MPRRCCVPCCTANYDKEKSYTTAFSFPKEEIQRKKWINSINRKDFVPGPSAVVCIRHFEESMIIREDHLTRADGTVLVMPREKLKLSNDAYPTIFPEQPSYLTKKLPKKRKLPAERENEMLARDELSFQKWCLEDNISSLVEFKEKVKEKIKPEWLYLCTEECVVIYKISTNESPKIVVCFKICNNLAVEVFHNNMPVDINTLTFMLGEHHQCDKWSKFEGLQNLLYSFKSNDVQVEFQLRTIVSLLENCISCVSDEKPESDLNVKLKFLSEQISLLLVKQLRYSPELLLWASKFYFSYSAAYMEIRKSGTLTLPHPSYLRRLITNLNCSGGSLNINKHASYLRKKGEMLESYEKVVNVLLDEIYITPMYSYKGGTIVGASNNSTLEATTIQTFMISSIFSKNKDVVALVPVKNLKAEHLYEYTLKVLEMLHKCDYEVVSLISDNNRINRNMFTIFCGGELKPFISNPVNEEKKLFFLFDTPHIMKSVRNNWLNQSATNQSFFYPNPEDHSAINVASLLHLRKIYDVEKTATVKQAPKLSQKVLFPTSTERQNVSHALNMFHESNSVALEVNSDKFGSDFLQTKTFISHISKWWKIVNCKHPLKGKHLRDSYCDPITELNHPNVLFLKEFHLWLVAWKELSELPKESKKKVNFPEKAGVLSKETQFAIMHTTNTMIEIVSYMFEKQKSKYVLLGKFQTDVLEGRFGQYRQMSGGNYHISMRQVLESENKLKVLSLITLQSQKAGEFKLTNLYCCDSELEVDVCEELPESFLEALTFSDEIDISEAVMSVLVYIAGYVAYKVQPSISCGNCSSVLSCNKDLKYECAKKEIWKYLELTDRGGLKWPKEFTVQLVVCTFRVFQILISEQFEEEFLSHSCQKDLLRQLSKEKIDLMNVKPVKKCECDLSFEKVISRCLSIISNILLNNYCKNINDRLISSKNQNKRKLLTLTASKAT